MNIGIYGGSFNPVHFGHVGLAKWIVEHTDIEEVWLMVSPNNPLKNTDELAPEQERLAGVRSAIQGIPGLIASDFEFALPRPSYTANTLRELTKAFPQHCFSLIIGEDNWEIFSQWREYEYILSNFPVLVYPRHCRGFADGEPTADRRRKQTLDCSAPSVTHLSNTHPSVTHLSDAPYFDISSTDIRHQS
ncbi:MAG: nicotinate (nicotinamide) nucleotide adenylyltransferase [Paludibacteraceae bacterium]|nr:nicotinate (nicotinamide) nucleotide adenylyltransferase [Paludibacteraceae bacterium]